MKNRCVILGGSIECAKPEITEQDYVICADRGYQHACLYGIRPDVIVGDFDSMEQPDDSKCDVRVYPTKKDDTDLMIALKLGLEKGFRQFAIYGALGGRIDHSIASIQSLSYLSEQNAEGTLYGCREEIRLLKEEKNYCFSQNALYFSLFSYESECELSVSGAEYPLEHGILNQNFPLGISNQKTDKELQITIWKGKALIVFVYEEEKIC